MRAGIAYAAGRHHIVVLYDLHNLMHKAGANVADASLVDLQREGPFVEQAEGGGGYGRASGHRMTRRKWTGALNDA